MTIGVFFVFTIVAFLGVRTHIHHSLIHSFERAHHITEKVFNRYVMSAKYLAQHLESEGKYNFVFFQNILELAKNSLERELFIQSPDGVLIAGTMKSEIGKKLPQAEWLSLGLAGRDYYGPLNSLNFTENLGLIYATPFKLQGYKDPFILIQIIPWENITTLLHEIDLAGVPQSSQNFMFLYDKEKGDVLYHTPEYQGEMFNKANFPLPFKSLFFSALSLEKNRSQIFQKNWVFAGAMRYYLIFSYLHFSWFLVFILALSIFLLLFVFCYILKIRQKMLYEREFHYRSIAEATPIPVLIFNTKEGKILQVNLPVTDILECSQNDFNGKSIWDFLNSNQDRDYLTNSLNNKIIVKDWEVSMRSAKGRSFWAILYCRIVEYENTMAGILAFYDITHRKEMERQLEYNAQHLEKLVDLRMKDLENKARELEETNAELEKARMTAESANASKSQFLANMSHELRTPLNAIIGYSEMLKEESDSVDPKQMNEDLSKINNAGKHLLSLINDVLDLSKIEAGKMELYLEKFQVVDMVKGVEEIVKPLIEKKNNFLTIECDASLGFMVSDLLKIRQNLFNLLSNAAKFTENGEIILKVIKYNDKDREWVEFSVTDTGIGMTPEQVNKIFQAFTQADNSKTRKYGGTGLGLTITKKFSQLLGGDASVSSVYEVGSTFKFFVPVDSTFMQEEQERPAMTY